MTPFEQWIAPATARPGLWRVLATLILTLFIWFIGIVLLILGIAVSRLLLGFESDLDGILDLAEGGSTSAIAFILASFWGIWLGFWVSLRLFHRQPVGTLISPDGRTRWHEAGTGFAIALAFSAGTIVPALLVEGLPDRSSLPIGTWALWCLAFLPLIWVQAGAEELLFRGYLLQQLAQRLRHPLLWAFPPALLFGALHYNGSLPGSAGLLYAIATTVLALSATVLTWRTGSLSAAIGLHVGINAVGIVGIGAEGLLEGSQLFIFRGGVSPTLLLIDTLMNVALLIYLLSPLAPFRRDAATQPDPAAR
ncbi:MAG: type II CAAX endopeptidase family protein [Pseudomonadota bacterium]